jgi:hypothetical protein
MGGCSAKIHSEVFEPSTKYARDAEYGRQCLKWFDAIYQYTKVIEKIPVSGKRTRKEKDRDRVEEFKEKLEPWLLEQLEQHANDSDPHMLTGIVLARVNYYLLCAYEHKIPLEQKEKIKEMMSYFQSISHNHRELSL